MTLLFFLGGTGTAAPVVADMAGFAYLEEVLPYNAQLEEFPDAAQLDETVTYNSQLSEER